MARPRLVLLLVVLACSVPSFSASGEDEDFASTSSFSGGAKLRRGARHKALSSRRSRLNDDVEADTEEGLGGGSGARRGRYSSEKLSARRRERSQEASDALDDLLDLEKSLSGGGENAGAGAGGSLRETQGGLSRIRMGEGSDMLSRSSSFKRPGSQNSFRLGGDPRTQQSEFSSSSRDDDATDASFSESSSGSLAKRKGSTYGSTDDLGSEGSSSAAAGAAGSSKDPEREEAAELMSSLKEEDAVVPVRTKRSSTPSTGGQAGFYTPPSGSDTGSSSSSGQSSGFSTLPRSSSSGAGLRNEDGSSSSPLPQLVSEQPAKSRNAYASVLYTGTPRDYEYFVGLRVTMQTLRRTGTAADLVVITSLNTPAAWIKTLEGDGLRVMKGPSVDNPYNRMAVYNPRFRFVLNKLLAWLLTDYKRVVLLDADNLVLHNTDELFLCGDFCAVFLNPCIFHTGLVVLKPSAKSFRSMRRQLAVLPSYDAADQGFLCSFFPDLLGAPLFEPPNASTPAALAEFKPLRGHYRLPMGYQMDAIYYNLKFKWEVPCSENKVITFPGISALKPWYWWTWPVLTLGLQWHMWRLSTIGYPSEFSASLFLAALWLAVLVGGRLWSCVAVLWRRRRPRAGASPQSPASPVKGQPVVGFAAWGKHFGLLRPTGDLPQAKRGSVRVALCLASVPASALVAYCTVPSTVHPFVGWPLFLLSTFGLLRVMRVILGAPRSLYWLPSYLGFAVVVAACPLYSALAFKLLVLHVLAFGGGIVTLLMYQSVQSRASEELDQSHSRAE